MQTSESTTIGNGFRTHTLSACEAMDRDDPLRALREEFRIPEGCIYLDGNSLGPLSRRAHERVRRTLEEEWAVGLIRSWNTSDWIGLPERLGARIARLIGAAPEEVTVADSTSVNLFNLAAACLRMAAPRRKIVTEQGNFPTDLYVLDGLSKLLPGVELRTAPREHVLEELDDDTALLVLTHVHYKSAEMYDMDEVTARARQVGARMLWDLSHSVGAVPLSLARAQVDLAVGCTYKYLNGGPGAPAFVYIRGDLQERLRPAISGWMGHAAPFELSDSYRPAQGVRRHRIGTPGILGMAALEGSLEVFDGVDLRLLREKSVALTTLFIELIEQECKGLGLELATPRDAAHRGSHVSYRHESGYEVMQELIERGVIGDFRAPDLLRFGFAPLYTRYVDVWNAVAILREILTTGSWQRMRARPRQAVT
ncbi:MAG TPA: kynureninase [Steroidobacteraceae bacterium]